MTVVFLHVHPAGERITRPGRGIAWVGRALRRSEDDELRPGPPFPEPLPRRAGVGPLRAAENVTEGVCLSITGRHGVLRRLVPGPCDVRRRTGPVCGRLVIVHLTPLLDR